MTAESRIDIRPVEGDAALLIAAINNASMPEDAWITEEQVRIQEGLFVPDDPPLKLAAWDGEQAVAFGFVGRNMFTAEGRCLIHIWVVPEYRQQGIASRIRDRLMPVVLERNAVALRTDVHEQYLPIAGAWLEREGFREVERMRPSELDLSEFDAAGWADALERVRSEGITLTTLGEDDTAENRRKVWEVSESTRQDIPHHGPSAPFPFEQFDDLLNRPEARPGCLVIANDGDRAVGFTLLVHQTPDHALTGMTGVLPEYRGRGIALALKAQCAALARDAGYRRMRTFNHINNPAMLAVNNRLGYRALPHEVIFQKDLQTADR